MNFIGNRHASTQQIAQWFDYDHLPDGLPKDASKAVQALVEDVLNDLELPDGPELTAGLRKLLEAKDCFVRSAITQTRGDYA